MNEQTKKINSKRTIVRILVLCATILLVAALAIPCFADTMTDVNTITPPSLPDSYPDLPPYDKDGYRITDDFIGDLFLRTYTTYMYESGVSLYHYTDIVDFLDYEFLGCGLIVTGYGFAPVYPPIYPSRDYYSNEFFLIGDLFDLAVVVGPYNERQVYFFRECVVRIDIWWDRDMAYDGGYYYMNIQFVPLDDSPIAQFVYETTEHGNIYLDKVVLGGVEYSADDVNVALAGYGPNCSTMFGILKSLFYGPNVGVASPKIFKESFVSIYNDGYDYGYEEGFADSFYIGYDEGYYDGYYEGVDEDLYQKALEQALEDIDSGQFGKNFLGGVFSAPFEALNSFTLVSWTTQAGTVVEITLGTVLSALIGVALFVWFLKLFAGG